MPEEKISWRDLTSPAATSGTISWTDGNQIFTHQLVSGPILLGSERDTQECTNGTSCYNTCVMTPGCLYVCHLKRRRQYALKSRCQNDATTHYRYTYAHGFIVCYFSSSLATIV